jgi:eukaryotic-like serine/threonine-protein kinase
MAMGEPEPPGTASTGADPASSVPTSSGSLPDGGMPIAIGDVIAGKYKVDRVLGRGGVGIVVQATHLVLNQRVAIKLLLSTTMPDAVARFLREAQAAVRLKSEHVARVLDVGELASGAPFMVMEFLEGKDLDDVLQIHGKVPIQDAVGYLLDACEAMAEAHAAGIVHRDLKPANLFLTTTADGGKTIKVLDFGISKDAGGLEGGDSSKKLTQTTAVFGSPLYMPPEQMRSARLAETRSDIWSLGVILYELVTGQPPFDAEMYPDLVFKVTLEPPPPPSSINRNIPPKLEAAILRCLEKDPAKRFPDIGKFAAAIAPFGPAGASASADRAQRMLITSRASIPSLEQSSAGGAGAALSRTASTWSSGSRTGARSKTGVVVAITLAVGAVAVLGAVALFATMGDTPSTGREIAPATEAQTTTTNGPGPAQSPAAGPTGISVVPGTEAAPQAPPPVATVEPPAKTPPQVNAPTGAQTAATLAPTAPASPGPTAAKTGAAPQAPAPPETAQAPSQPGTPPPTTTQGKRNPFDMTIK